MFHALVHQYGDTTHNELNWSFITLFYKQMNKITQVNKTKALE